MRETIIHPLCRNSFTRGSSPVSPGMAERNLELRRQSTIGIRGSPENNALIRFIAHRKRMKTEDAPSQASPFQQNALLKNKIAAFQSSFKPITEDKEDIIRTLYTSKKADTRSHEQSQLDQVGPPEYKTVALEETLNCKGENHSADIQEIPVLHQNTLESQHLILEAVPAAGISNTACALQSPNTNEELSGSTTSRRNCKKVRFAEKQSLEIFDETKPPITPLQKGYFHSMYNDDSPCLHSVLKKTPVRMLTAEAKEHLDYTNTGKGSEELTVLQSCGPLQTEGCTRPIDRMEAYNMEVDVKVFDSFQPVDTPVHSEEASFSTSGSRNYSSLNITPVKNTLFQPNFDDSSLQETSEVVSAIESGVNSADAEEETKVSYPDVHAIRVTRSSAKKQVNKEMSVSLTRKTRTKKTHTTRKVSNPRKFQNENSVTTSPSIKKPASSRKAFGKRKRKKKTQKVFHGHCETVSKKPLLSPIPEMTEDISLVSFCQSPTESSVSILDGSCSSLVHEKPEETNSILQSAEEGGNYQHSNLSAVKEDALPDNVLCSFLQLQNTVPNDAPITFPLEPPSSDSSKDLKNTLNGQVLKSDCSSKSEMELRLLNLQATGEKNSKEGSLLTADSAIEQPSEDDTCVNFKRFPRSSRRFSLSLPSVESLQSEIPNNNPCDPTGSMEELSCTSDTENNARFLNDVLYAIEESFRSVTSNTEKRVRRSMRRLKNAESEGLAWISIPIDDSANEAQVGSVRKAKRRSFIFCHPESEILHQKQENLVQILSPMMKEQESVPVEVEHCRPRKKRKSIYSQGQG